MMFYNGYNLLLDLILVILAYELGMYFATKNATRKVSK